LFEPGEVNDLQKKMERLLTNPPPVHTFAKIIPDVRSIESQAREIEKI
jgi:hypothetical protein